MKKYMSVRIREETYMLILDIQNFLFEKKREKKKIVEIIHEAIELYYKNIK